MIGGAKGIGIGLDFGIGNQSRPKGGGKYLDPAVKEALCGVWIADQNTNESPTRNIIKNKLSDRGGDFEILNAAYKLNSGYGEYGEDFTRFRSPFGALATVKHDAYNIKGTISNGWLIYLPNNTKTNQTKVSISGIKDNYYLIYDYHQNDGNFRLEIKEDGVYDIPANDGLGDGRGSGFMLVGISGDTNIDITIKQIPSYQGAFVTDGVDDMIVSEKSMTEILNGSNEFTVISMIHQIDMTKSSTLNNVVTIKRASGVDIYYQPITLKEKTGMYGYTYKDDSIVTINSILGDKNDYKTSRGNDNSYNDQYSVEGYINKGNYIYSISKVAWYWTLIAKRVLTTDEINQVIAYYNLDKYVTPDVYYNVKKQGLTNENHAEFGDKLIDYSGNGRDMQLYNIGWKLNSGVGKYRTAFATSFWIKSMNGSIIDITDTMFKAKVNARENVLFNIAANLTENIPSFKIKVESTVRITYVYIDSNLKVTSIAIPKVGIFEVPESYTKDYTGGAYCGFFLENAGESTITQISEYENALVFNGVDDYGQYVGDLGLKDYTVVADRAYTKINTSQVPIISALDRGAATAPFTYEHVPGNESRVAPFSFGVSTNIPSSIKVDREISYQSTYIYNSTAINKGTSTSTGTGLTFGRYGDNYQYAALCLYSFILFPYTLSEFLLERQLKKRKLGTLYPGMIEFRPSISANLGYNVVQIVIDNNIIYYWMNGTTITNKSGKYFPKGSTMTIRAKCDNTLRIPSKIKYNGKEYNTIYDSLYNMYYIEVVLDKSPQKINIHIDEYIRYEDIGQPYPALFSFYETENPDKVLTWGSKLRVGSTIKVKSITHLLGELYNITKYVYNDKSLSYVELMSKEFVVKNNLSFKTGVTYILNNEPKCILSPKRLSIPNSSYKILGYIPDISGHGNHGKLNNSAYAEGSGVNADGSYGLDGVDDFISIPTLSSGGKQVLMKVNWNNETSAMLYDQRTTYNNAFAIYVNGGTIAYNSLNVGGNTYIDGILNNSITCIALKEITHNITCLNSSELPSQSPKIGTNFGNSATFATMSLYTFMLFDEISTEEEIKELNEIVGIEGNTNDLFNPTN